MFFQCWDFDFPGCQVFCLSHLIFQEPYIIWYDVHLWYTCIYKWIISPGIVFIFFKILNFGIIEGEGGRGVGKGAKHCPVTKNRLSHSISQELHIMYCDFWYLCVKWWCIQQTFSFFNILILGFFRGVKGQKIA